MTCCRASVHTLRGHTSTVRCLKMADANTAISGSRDTTLRIWDLRTGLCKNVLVGHQASVRCLGIHGDIVVSGSYDTTARIWSISEGRCLRALTGHFSQIYAIAFDGTKIATGSLDTSVRIWDPISGACNAILQGHTSLVGQLQMRGDTLVSGGSDGSVRVWSLSAGAPVHRLAAHDNSVTSLQFDDVRIVSGGSDGRVKIWSLKTGQLVRELSQPAESVWRVAFEEEKCVIMASRANRTVMEVSRSTISSDILSLTISRYGRSPHPTKFLCFAIRQAALSCQTISWIDILMANPTGMMKTARCATFEIRPMDMLGPKKGWNHIAALSLWRFPCDMAAARACDTEINHVLATASPASPASHWVFDGTLGFLRSQHTRGWSP